MTADGLEMDEDDTDDPYGLTVVRRLGESDTVVDQVADRVVEALERTGATLSARGHDSTVSRGRVSTSQAPWPDALYQAEIVVEQHFRRSFLSARDEPLDTEELLTQLAFYLRQGDEPMPMALASVLSIDSRRGAIDFVLVGGFDQRDPTVERAFFEVYDHPSYNEHLNRAGAEKLLGLYGEDTMLTAPGVAALLAPWQARAQAVRLKAAVTDDSPETSPQDGSARKPKAF